MFFVKKIRKNFNQPVFFWFLWKKWLYWNYLFFDLWILFTWFNEFENINLKNKLLSICIFPHSVFHMEKCFFSPEVFFLTLFQESLKSRQVSGHKHTREKMTSSDSRRRNFFTWPLGASTDTEHSQTSFITYFLYLHVFQTVVEHFECWLLTKRNMNIS